MRSREETTVGIIEIDLSNLSKFYNYTPFPPTAEKIPLNLDWENVKEKLAEQVQSSLPHINQEDEGELIPLESIRIDSNDDEIVYLHSLIRIRPKVEGKEHKYKLELRLSHYLLQGDNYETHNCSEISLHKKTKTDWDLRHRRVKEAYLNQGIGSKLFKICESIVQKEADDSQTVQEIQVSVGQLSVIKWFLKNGFEVTPEDNDRINRVINGDSSLMIVSAPMDEDEAIKRQWYIVEKSIYNSIDEEEFWEGVAENGEKKYVVHSYRIRLRKHIQPTNNQIETSTNRFQDEIHSGLPI